MQAFLNSYWFYILKCGKNIQITTLNNEMLYYTKAATTPIVTVCMSSAYISVVHSVEASAIGTTQL